MKIKIVKDITAEKDPISDIGIVGRDNTSSPIDDIIKSYSRDQGEFSIDLKNDVDTKGENLAGKEESGKTVAPSVDIDIVPKGATKKRGRKNKSLEVPNIPGSIVVRVGQILIGGILHAIVEKLTKRPHKKDVFFLTEDEQEVIEPIVDALIAKYMAGISPEALLAYTLAIIYGSKISVVIFSNKN